MQCVVTIVTLHKACVASKRLSVWAKTLMERRKRTVLLDKLLLWPRLEGQSEGQSVRDVASDGVPVPGGGSKGEFHRSHPPWHSSRDVTGSVDTTPLNTVYSQILTTTPAGRNKGFSVHL